MRGRTKAENQYFSYQKFFFEKKYEKYQFSALVRPRIRTAVKSYGGSLLEKIFVSAILGRQIDFECAML